MSVDNNGKNKLYKEERHPSEEIIPYLFITSHAWQDSSNTKLHYWIKLASKQKKSEMRNLEIKREVKGINKSTRPIETDYTILPVTAP